MTKTVDPDEVAAPGADVTFTVTVKNDSSSDAVTVNSLVDTVQAGIGNNCAPALPAKFQPGESITCQLTSYVGGKAGDVYSSRVIASGTDDDGYPVGDSAEATVQVVNPPAYFIFLPLTWK